MIKFFDKKFTKKQKGFTLIELLVVISIVSLLSSIVIATLSNTKSKARDAKRKSDLNQIQTALTLYFDNNGSYPAGEAFSTWSTTTWGIAGNPSTLDLYTKLVGGSPKYMDKLPIDPINVEHDIGNGSAGYYLGDNAPADQAYMYRASNGNLSYTLGTNLENGGGPANTLGNYQLTNQL